MNEFPKDEVAVFTEALQLPANQRAAYLEYACVGDEKLRERVEALLQTHDQVGDFLELSPQKPAAQTSLEMAPSEKAGDWVGRYKLLEQIGEGGCGVVFMAEQEEPVRRRVAVKMIKPGMDSKNVIARFETERQALALMDHPGIAKVFDAGATKCGRPYFVMELIRGVKITEYCDQHELPTEERLKLFVQVCQAVQHAHQKGVIHRDIKPSNILVTTASQGTAMPMVIDFGIAKATTNQLLTGKTLFTAFEMLIGTPAYMSPEQAALTTVDVDTRTDIYSLGVLLYELLTGSTPFDTRNLLKAGFDEIRRVIRDEEPIRPSTRLSHMTKADLTTVAQRRNSEPPVLIRSIAGDLDWIVMKALEKERTRRYETANGLALDVQRFLCDEAISARPPSALYKFQKTVLRNRFLFASLSVITLLLVVSLVVVSASLSKERQARHEADVALKQAEADRAKAQIEKTEAQTEAAKSQQITQFLEDMLQSVGPSVARGRDTTMMHEILDRTAERVGIEMTNQPILQAELYSLIGRVYFEIGNYNQSEKMHGQALAINQKQFGPDNPEVAASFNDLGMALYREGNLADAEKALLEALRIRRSLFGEENADVATTLNNLASVFRHESKTEESEALTRESLGIRQKLFGDDSLEVADTLHNLSVVLCDEGKPAEGEATAREMLAMRRKLLGPEDLSVAAALADLAWAANVSGKLDEAVSSEKQALVMQQKLLGNDAPDVSNSLNFFGQLLTRQGNLQASEAALREALSNQNNLSGADNPSSLNTLRNLGLVLEAEGNLGEAEKMHREALTLWRKRGEGKSSEALAEVDGLAHILMTENKLGDAEQLLDETLTPALVSNPAFLSKPPAGDILDLGVDLEARRGQWQEAANNASLAFELQPKQDSRFSTLAALLLKSQNRTGYEQLRKTLLATFANTSNIFAADQVAKSCLFLPPSEADLPIIGHLADTSVTLGSGDSGAMPFFEVCKALSEFRQGHFAEAAEWAEKTIESPRIDAHGYACAVLAMAYWQLGEKDKARAILAKGNELAPASMPVNVAEDPGNAWLKWLQARIQLDEATALIQPDSTTVSTSNKRE